MKISYVLIHWYIVTWSIIFLKHAEDQENQFMCTHLYGNIYTYVTHILVYNFLIAFFSSWFLFMNITPKVLFLFGVVFLRRPILVPIYMVSYKLVFHNFFFLKKILVLETEIQIYLRWTFCRQRLLCALFTIYSAPRIVSETYKGFHKFCWMKCMI